MNREDIVVLWKTCFGDSEEYIDFFINNCPQYICIQYWLENELVSMLFLLEGNLCNNKAKYLYAACTHPDFRRKGIMEELIKYSEKYCKALGYSAIFLVPANKQLYDYYNKFGFSASFRRNCVSLTPEHSASGLDFKETSDIDKILSLRKKLVAKYDSFIFEDSVMKYSFKEHLYNGGKILVSDNAEQSALIFYYKDGSNIIVKELLCSSDEVYGAVIKHFHNKNVENLYICTPIVYNCKDKVGEYTKCGMCLALNDEMSVFLTTHNNLYAALYLD